MQYKRKIIKHTLITLNVLQLFLGFHDCILLNQFRYLTVRTVFCRILLTAQTVKELQNDKLPEYYIRICFQYISIVMFYFMCSLVLSEVWNYTCNVQKTNKSLPTYFIHDLGRLQSSSLHSIDLELSNKNINLSTTWFGPATNR